MPSPANAGEVAEKSIRLCIFPLNADEPNSPTKQKLSWRHSARSPSRGPTPLNSESVTLALESKPSSL